MGDRGSMRRAGGRTDAPDVTVLVLPSPVGVVQATMGPRGRGMG